MPTSSDSECRAEGSSTRVSHCKRDDCSVYIGRHRTNDDELRHLNNTAIGERGWLGNPYRLEDGYSREESVARFTRDLLSRVDSDPEFRRALYQLQGETLGGWCQGVDEDEPLCHGEVLARVIDGIEKHSG